ncbi:MAG: NAD(P)/FAD-dependent oxidoreductase [Acidobacteria bacterium]|nr:NAD(P)/FAD-dependent oxidoreductase [Acidobacteriota bacterium]
MAEYDALFVGSGINSLVGAALLAKAGWKVCVLERNSWLGGNIRTEEITVPGYTHDVLSGWHPLFTGSAGYGELKEDLHARGLEYLNTQYPTGAIVGETPVFLSTLQEANVQEFERHHGGDGKAWEQAIASFLAKADIAFGMLGTELWSSDGLKLLIKAVRKLGKRGSLEFGGELLSSCRHWLTENFQSPAVHGLLAPWVLHTGLGPDNAGSGYMTQVIAAALQLGGMPVPRGGGARLVDALVRLVRDYGGTLETDIDVEQVLVSGGRAYAVRTNGGSIIAARRAVVCCVTPTQLYLRLLHGSTLPDWVQERARNYRYGRADMQIHMALSERPKWLGGDERFLKTAIVHITSGLNGVSRAVNQAERGLLPAESTIAVGQPMAVDPSRGPAEGWIIWIQLQELPPRPEGDAAGEIDTGDGTWTESLRERYADRIVERLGKFIPNLQGATLKRVVVSPADLQAANVNLVGGDPYAGSCSLDQFFLWRPFRGMPHHRTPIASLFHIGASTHPGPGLHGASGFMVAKQLLNPGLLSRIFSR